MLGLTRTAFCVLLLCPAPLLAASVFRCEDANGHLTFTSQGCPSEQQQRLQHASNATPGSGKPVAMAKPATLQRDMPPPTSSKLVVVGQQDDGCGNRITGSTRRQAMIKHEVRAGMTLADVESTLGRPNKISSQNGQLRYQYLDNQGRSRQVSFDENRCVKGKR
jgi:hypothetical protein